MASMVADKRGLKRRLATLNPPQGKMAAVSDVTGATVARCARFLRISIGFPGLDYRREAPIIMCFTDIFELIVFLGLVRVFFAVVNRFI